MLNGIDINPVKKQPDCIKNQKGKPCADANQLRIFHEAGFLNERYAEFAGMLVNQNE